MNKILWYILIIVPLTGCVKAVDWPVAVPQTGFITVDAILTDEPNTQSVRIFYPVSQLNEVPLPVTGATVLISNEDSTWALSVNPEKPGVYQAGPGFVATSDKNYTLFISHDSKVYSAKASMVPGSVFKELQYKKNSENLYYIDWVASAYSAEKAAMWEILLDWSAVPGYEQADTSLTKVRMLFYTLPTLDVSEIFAPVMENITFPTGTTITEKRYSLTSEHAEFARELLLETNWAGGFFNLASANVMTNLSSGAKGYFGICSVTSLSITVIPEK
jgi:hypothetical protein